MTNDKIQDSNKYEERKKIKEIVDELEQHISWSFLSIAFIILFILITAW